MTLTNDKNVGSFAASIRLRHRLLSVALLLLVCVTNPCHGLSGFLFSRSMLSRYKEDSRHIQKLQLARREVTAVPSVTASDGAASEGPVGVAVLLDSRAGNVTSSGTGNVTAGSSKKEPDPTYGQLPVSDTVVGNLFLLLAYGFILFKAAKFLSEGSELLLAVMDPGIIGGLLLPILGVLPDSLLILVSGLGGTKEEAQKQVLVGIGLLAGSTVFLLTVLWGACLIIGRCDLEVSSGRQVAVDKKLTKQFSLTGTGVTTDYLTKISSRIMMVTILPFVVAQLPKIFRFRARGNIPVIVACVLSLGGLVAYCLYQVFSPKLLGRKRAMAKEKFHKLFVIGKLVKASQVNLLNAKGDINMEMIDKMFSLFDLDKDDHLSELELRYLINASSLVQDKTDAAYVEGALEHLMTEFDVTSDKQISRDEFKEGMKKWLGTIMWHQKPFGVAEAQEAAKQAEGEYAEFKETENEEAEETEKPLTREQIIRKSVLLLFGGTILAAVFADPLVDAVNEFSNVTHIPPFFISFVLLPLASNSSEGVSSILFASRKMKRNMSLTYSQIYGGVTMNNTIGLGIFLAVVYGRHLVWDFSSEVLIIVLVTMVMGLLAAFRNTFPLWMAAIALSLYPISLGLVAILDYVAGWE